MRFYEMTSMPAAKYRPRLIARRYVKRTNTPIPHDILAFLRKHVKKEGQEGGPTYLILNQYDDDWYEYTFRDPNIKDFTSFFETKIAPYFTIQNPS